MDKPWLKHYEPHVPEHINYPDMLLPQALKHSAEKYPERAAIIFKGARMSYAELDETVDRLAAALQQLGVAKGDRVAIHMPNCPQFVLAYYATLRLGGIVVPCNPLYRAHEMVHQLNNSGAKIIFTLSNTYPLVHQIRGETALRQVIVAQIKTYFPLHLRLLFGLLLEKKKGHYADIRGDPHTSWFQDLLKNVPPSPALVELSGDDVAVLMYTGGTTGVPKGAELTHRNIFVNAYMCKVWLNSNDGQEVDMAQMPLFHAFGMTGAMNLSVLIAATMVLVPDPRDINDVIHTIQRFKPTIYPGVPMIYNSIINYPNIQKYDLSSIRNCFSGGAGLPREIQEKFEQLTGANVVEGYGLSESSPITIGNPVTAGKRIGTIGLPWPDTDVKIVDAESGTRILGTGEEGELCIRGPHIMRGYWNNPAETANTLQVDSADPNPQPWLYTGDIATMDSDGYFRIVDRKKDVIISGGGYKVFPREVEELLYRHPSVREAAVVGIPYEKKGERVKAFVVLKPGEQVTADEIIQFCQKNLAAYKVPKFVEFRDVIPNTASGKPLRRQLRDESIQAHAAAPVATPALEVTAPENVMP
ncbi:MAG: long-chain fatty acid--CoA ligase [Anaerolineae bacterium]